MGEALIASLVFAAVFMVVNWTSGKKETRGTQGPAPVVVSSEILPAVTITSTRTSTTRSPPTTTRTSTTKRVTTTTEAVVQAEPLAAPEVKPEAIMPEPAAPVEVSGAPASAPAFAKGFSVQIASMPSEFDAKKKLAWIEEKGLKGFVQSMEVNGKLYHRVKLGPVATQAEAKALKAEAEKTLGVSGSIITKEK